MRDPISRAIESKPVKPWLINQTNLLLERGQLRIPNRKIDEVLVRQMLNYRVTKITENGIPKFSSDDEHALDAMIFALYGFMETYPELINIVDKVEPARRSHVVNTKKTDPIKERIQQVTEDRSDSNELKTYSSRVKPGLASRASRNSRGINELSWGRRGFKKRTNRKF